MPPADSGRAAQRPARPRAAPPRTAPWVRTASAAYTEQDGWNRQRAPSIGPSARRYRPQRSRGARARNGHPRAPRRERLMRPAGARASAGSRGPTSPRAPWPLRSMVGPRRRRRGRLDPRSERPPRLAQQAPGSVALHGAADLAAGHEAGARGPPPRSPRTVSPGLRARPCPRSSTRSKSAAAKRGGLQGESGLLRRTAASRPLRAAAGQDRAAGPGAHPQAETVLLLRASGCWAGTCASRATSSGAQSIGADPRVDPGRGRAVGAATQKVRQNPPRRVGRREAGAMIRALPASFPQPPLPRPNRISLYPHLWKVLVEKATLDNARGSMPVRCGNARLRSLEPSSRASPRSRCGSPTSSPRVWTARPSS